MPTIGLSGQLESILQHKALITQWLVEAWKSIHRELQSKIRRSFGKCGIPVDIDKSEDNEINTQGLGDQYPRQAPGKLSSSYHHGRRPFDPGEHIDPDDPYGPSDPSDSPDPSNSAESLS